MNILWCIPCVTPCGGMRVVFEYANRMVRLGHDVTLASPVVSRPDWFDLDKRITIIGPAEIQRARWDVAIATSPNTVYDAARAAAERKIYFVQMMEHLFFAPATEQYALNLAFYAQAEAAGFKFITIARWLKDELAKWTKQDVPVIVNGVNRGQFKPIDGWPRTHILVPGDGRNYAKDVDRIAWKVALRLSERYQIPVAGFAAHPHDHSGHGWFTAKPPVYAMRIHYASAKIVIKASRFEGWSCETAEAMACGAAIVRAITMGDEGLRDGVNCLRTPYDEKALFVAAERLLTDDPLRARIEAAALETARTLDWDKCTKRMVAEIA